MLTICLVKLISVLLNYIDVRGKATNKLYFFKQQAKKKKKKNPQYIMTKKLNQPPLKHSDSGFSFCCLRPSVAILEILLDICKYAD